MDRNDRDETTLPYDNCERPNDAAITDEVPINDEESKTSPTAPPPPPNGGLTAWVQCTDTFFLWFAVWGLVNSFGVFQAYYETALPGTSSSSISWIGSLQVSIFIAGTIFIGPLFDMGYLRSLLIVGSLLTVFGLMMTSLAHTFWQVLLAQGIAMGLGMTCLFTPCVAVLPPYFSSRRALAMGIAASGSSIGAIILTIIFQQLQPKVGFGWTVRIMAFVLLASLLLPIATMRKRAAKAPRRALIDKSALRELPFILTMCSMFVAFIGLYIPYFYIEVFSVRAEILNSDSTYLNKYLIVFLNVGSAVGRLLPNILADKIGSWNMIIAVSFLTAITAFSWVSVASQGSLIAFCIFYGFFSGSVVALVAVLWAIVAPDARVLGTRIGMMTLPMAAGLLIGNPVAGTLVHGTSFVDLQVFCGCTVLGGSVFLLFGRLAQARTGAPLKT